MRTLPNIDLEAYARASRRAALLTAVGALIVLGSLIYSAWKLTALSATVSAKQDELRALQAREEQLKSILEEHKRQDADVLQDLERLKKEREGLQAEIDSLKTSRQVQAKQNLTLRDSLRQIESTVKRAEAPDLAYTVNRLTPISALVTPRAQEKLISGLVTSDGKQIYDFSLWLDIPDQEKAKIQEVSYEFNHPTFRQPRQVSSEPSTGFRVGYRGWGCLSSVIITIRPREGEPEKIDFDMCRALEAEVPKK